MFRLFNSATFLIPMTFTATELVWQDQAEPPKSYPFTTKIKAYSPWPFQYNFFWPIILLAFDTFLLSAYLPETPLYITSAIILIFNAINPSCKIPNLDPSNLIFFHPAKVLWDAIEETYTVIFTHATQQGMLKKLNTNLILCRKTWFYILRHLSLMRLNS